MTDVLQKIRKIISTNDPGSGQYMDMGNESESLVWNHSGPNSHKLLSNIVKEAQATLGLDRPERRKTMGYRLDDSSETLLDVYTLGNLSIVTRLTLGFAVVSGTSSKSGSESRKTAHRDTSKDSVSISVEPKNMSGVGVKRLGENMERFNDLKKEFYSLAKLLPGGRRHHRIKDSSPNPLHWSIQWTKKGGKGGRNQLAHAIKRAIAADFSMTNTPTSSGDANYTGSAIRLVRPGWVIRAGSSFGPTIKDNYHYMSLQPDIDHWEGAQWDTVSEEYRRVCEALLDVAK